MVDEIFNQGSTFSLGSNIFGPTFNRAKSAGLEGYIFPDDGFWNNLIGMESKIYFLDQSIFHQWQQIDAIISGLSGAGINIPRLRFIL